MYNHLRQGRKVKVNECTIFRTEDEHGRKVFSWSSTYGVTGVLKVSIENLRFICRFASTSKDYSYTILK